MIIRIGKLLFILAVLYFSFLMLMISWPYFAMDKHARIQFLMTKLNVYHIDYWRIGFYAHIFTSVLVLLAGATQFSVYLLHRVPKIHRFMGWIYISVVLLFSGPGAFVMAMHANGGIAARVSFVILTSIWLYVTFMALRKVLKRDYIAHGNFMLRSYVLTFSAVTLRLYLIIINYFHFGLSPIEKYVLVAWLSWIPNLLLAEWMIYRGFSLKLLIKRNA